MEPCWSGKDDTGGGSQGPKSGKEAMERRVPAPERMTTDSSH